ncbi:MAG: hypothetical protein GY719_06835 [bacterium]|nr:hypothetical protein [bacterium]
MRIERILWSSLILVLLLAALGCNKKEEAAPEPAVRVENAQAGVAIADLSTDFTVADNSGPSVELVPTGEGATGKVSILAGEPETGGINLVAAIKQHKAEVLERPGGEYKGQTELVGPLGTTYASRGRYTGEDGGTVEEIIVYMVHPLGDRTLQAIYRYPAGEDTKERMDALIFGVVGELVPLDPPPAEGG